MYATIGGMATLIHADIFFFITSVVTVILGILVAVALFYIVLILRDLRHISDLAQKSGDKLAGDLDELREAAKEEGLKMKTIFDFFIALLIRRAKQKMSGKKKTDN